MNKAFSEQMLCAPQAKTISQVNHSRETAHAHAWLAKRCYGGHHAWIMSAGCAAVQQHFTQQTHRGAYSVIQTDGLHEPLMFSICNIIILSSDPYPISFTLTQHTAPSSSHPQVVGQFTQQTRWRSTLCHPDPWPALCNIFIACLFPTLNLPHPP